MTLSSLTKTLWIILAGYEGAMYELFDYDIELSKLTFFSMIIF